MNDIEVIELQSLKEDQKIKLLDLWNSEYPAKLAYSNLSDFSNYLKNLSNLKHVLLYNQNNQISGWAFSFEREDLKWFAVILSAEIQRKGYGRKLLDKLKSGEKELNGWVIDHNFDKKANGETYKSPLEFYTKCSFKVQSDQRLELEKISAVKIRWQESLPRMD